MSISPDRRRPEEKDLAATLRQLRKAAGLSGERLAVRCSMSQAKISRIEGRKITPTVADVERILIALDVPATVADGLVALARRVNVQHTSWRAAAEIGLWRKQDELKALADSATTIRQFLPAMPSGLVQTEDYARAVSERPNVELAVILQSTQVTGAALNTFVIYDERLVLVELFSGEVVLRDPRDIAHHLQVFDFFLRHALRGADAAAFLRSAAAEFRSAT